jgi:hypothetical protein
MSEQAPNWQPISMLAFLTDHIAGGIAMVAEQKATLERGLAKPYALDDATVARVKTVFSQTAADNEMFAEQGRRWAAQPDLTADQRRGVERYQELVEQITAETHAVLALADQLAGATIETLMAKSDLEVGIEAILRGGKL